MIEKVMRVAAVGAMLLCLASTVRADNLEYRYELGVAVGGSSYYGDANYHSLLNNMSFMGGIMGRYNINPRMALKASLSAAGIAGTTAGLDNTFPGGNVEFSRVIYDLGAQFECHFIGYGDGTGYKRSSRLSPYIFAGAGLTFAPKPASNVFTMNLPLGVGLKYKIAPRLNLGCELSFRFTLSDKLDVTKETAPVLNDPYGVKSGFLKNKDSYSFLSISVSYDLSPKYRECNN